MNKIRCTAIDDEPLALTILKEYASKVPFLEMTETFVNPSEAMQYIHTSRPDILFLDIQMPEILGLDFIKTLTYKPVIILTTAYSEYALDGFNLDVTDYLLKPIPFDRFLQAVNKAVRFISPETKVNPGIEKDFLSVKSGYKNLKVGFSEIIYVEGFKEYVTIYTSSQKLVKLETMKNLEEILPKNTFLRVHKSYIVNLSFVKAYYGNVLEVDNKSIPVGRAYKEQVNRVLK